MSLEETPEQLFIYRTIDKKDRIGLAGVFDKLVEGGVPRWKALAWTCFISPPHIQKRIMELTQ